MDCSTYETQSHKAVERKGCLRRTAVVLVTGLAAIGFLTAGAAAAMAPLIVSPPRTAVVPDQFGGTPPPSTPASPQTSTESDSPEVPLGDPPIIQVGASIPVVDGPAALGSVTVLQHRSESAATGGTRLLVEVHYRAEQAFEIRPEAWVASTVDGDEAAGHPATVAPAVDAKTLAAGETMTGWVEFDLPATATDLFLDYEDPDGSTLFIVALF